jgi:solute:Na+ symporter, SSS family
MSSITIPILPLLAQFGPIDWAIVGTYLAIIIVIGVRAAIKESRQKSGTNEFFMADRRIPSWVLAISIVASMLSAATFVGAPSEAYRGNLTYLILNVGGFMAVFVVGLFFVPRLYRSGTVTIYGFLATRFGETARVGVSITFLVGRMFASGSRLMLVAFPLCLMLFGNQTPQFWQLCLAISVVGLFGTFYTTFGGISTVVWVDLIQFVLVVGAALVTIGMLLSEIPVGPMELLHVLNDPKNTADGSSKLLLFDARFAWDLPYTIWAAITGSFLVGLATYGVDHDFAQRFMIAKSPARGAITVILAQFISISVVALFMIIGLLLFVFYQRPDIMNWAPGAAPVTPDPTMPVYQHFMIFQMPTVIAGLAVAGLFAVSQGSMDSAINAMASSAIADLYLPWKKRLNPSMDESKPMDAPKIAVAIIGVLMTLVAIGFASIYDPTQRTFLNFALGVLNFALSGMLAVFLTGLFTKRGNNASVIGALITGFCVTLVMQDFIWVHVRAQIPSLPTKIEFTYAMAIATGAAFLVCLFGGPKSPAASFPTEAAR